MYMMRGLPGCAIPQCFALKFLTHMSRLGHVEPLMVTGGHVWALEIQHVFLIISCDRADESDEKKRLKIPSCKLSSRWEKCNFKCPC